MSSTKLGKIMAVIFVIAGIGFVIGAFVFRSHSTQFYADAKETTATIDTIYEYEEYDNVNDEYETKHDVYISYDTQEGEHYSDVKLGWYYTGMEEGQTITVHYDPDDPEDVRAKEGSTFGFVGMLIMGIVFAIMGAGFAFAVRFENRAFNGHTDGK